MTCPHCQTPDNYWIANYIDGRSAAICNGCGIHMDFLGSQALTGDSIMPFGSKHKGWKLKDVPAQYWEWMMRDVPNMSPELREYARAVLQEAR